MAPAGDEVKEEVDSKYTHYTRKEVISMPRKDGTGPMGCDPRTGRGAGSCTENQGSYISGHGSGMGYGRRNRFRGSMGMGRGAGWGSSFVHSTPQEERSFLENQMEVLQNKLNFLKQRVEELSTQEEK
jgi:hypothetical protein